MTASTIERLPEVLLIRILRLSGAERERRLASRACRAFASLASKNLLDCRLVRIRVRTDGVLESDGQPGRHIAEISLYFDDGVVQVLGGNRPDEEVRGSPLIPTTEESFDIAPGDKLLHVELFRFEPDSRIISAMKFFTRFSERRFPAEDLAPRQLTLVQNFHSSSGGGIRGLNASLTPSIGVSTSGQYEFSYLSGIWAAFEKPRSVIRYWM